MRNGIFHLVTGAALAIALSATSASAQKKYDPGASDTEIKIGQTVPFSGPASAYASIGKTQAAYFKMINDSQGGIKGRKINLIQYDDAYSPTPKAVEQVRKLVESDEVLLTFQIVGTPSIAAVQKYLNAKKVPQLFAATGASKFTDPKNFPWTLGFNPNYFVEGRIYGQYILKEHPNAKIGVLYQNDDLVKDYLNGIKAGLGDKAAEMIVAEASYEVSDPTVDSQVIKIKDAGARLIMQVQTLAMARAAAKLGADVIIAQGVEAGGHGADPTAGRATLPFEQEETVLERLKQLEDALSQELSEAKHERRELRKDVTCLVNTWSEFQQRHGKLLDLLLEREETRRKVSAAVIAKILRGADLGNGRFDRSRGVGMDKKPHPLEDSQPVTVSELCAAVQGARVMLMVQDGGDIFQHLDDGRILMFTVVGHGSLAFELASLETLQ